MARSIPPASQPPPAEKVLKITYLEAKLYKSDVIGTEHLLLSLLRDDENLAAQILQQGFSITYDGVRSELDTIISGKSSPSASSSGGSGKGSGSGTSILVRNFYIICTNT